MVLSLIATFILLMGLVIAGIQNTASFEMRFLAWSLQMSLTVIIFYAYVLGGSIVALLTLPRMVRLFGRAGRSEGKRETSDSVWSHSRDLLLRLRSRKKNSVLHPGEAVMLDVRMQELL